MSDPYARDLPPVLTLEQVADLLQVSKRTLQRRIGAEELAAFKIGRQWRIARKDLEDYLRRHHAGGDLYVL